MNDKIAVLDFGSQYTQLIARRIRELGIFCQVFRADEAHVFEAVQGVGGVVLSDGAHASQSAPLLEHLRSLPCPLLAIGGSAYALCGAPALAHNLRQPPRQLRIPVPCHPLLAPLAPSGNTPAQPSSPVLSFLAPSPLALGASWESIAHFAEGEVAAVAHRQKPWLGVFFHIETSKTPVGADIFRNFLQGVCQMKGTWQVDEIAQQAILEIRAQVQEGKVLCALSGGVDSTVTAVLVHKAIGNRLQCIYVNTGLMREGETESVARMFERFQIPLEVVDARERFLGQLAGVTEPETKRKRIGAEFIAVFEEAAAKFEGIAFLAQGTIYPDIIESMPLPGGTPVKSHHNVGGLPERMQLQLVEPLKHLFKDEVRKLGKHLGLEAAFVERQPFPGPGLAVRVLGEVTEAKLAVLRKADALLQEEVAQLQHKPWQVFAVLLPVQSVGATREKRTYAPTLALRAVESQDGMTASPTHLPWAFLDKVSSRLLAEVEGINRVVLDISPKPPATIEWE
ncbi:MAG: glutamine-hydrolyzing GMP synthase [Cystobacterineae bacterium]|nr:glutamine-hydrolyzing GMP synthase [Cystobacterineae bacterium]MCL2259212.1 glutamine-hydrolyzing GMP synthase [Cystobacterineae bacterium]